MKTTIVNCKECDEEFPVVSMTAAQIDDLSPNANGLCSECRNQKEKNEQTARDIEYSDYEQRRSFYGGNYLLPFLLFIGCSYALFTETATADELPLGCYVTLKDLKAGHLKCYHQKGFSSFFQAKHNLTLPDAEKAYGQIAGAVIYSYSQALANLGGIPIEGSSILFDKSIKQPKLKLSNK